MMDQEIYKKLLLEKFFEKNLSRDERHELEKLALDDPFLFEAMEGFTEVEGDHAADVKRIQAKKLRVKKKKKRSLIPYGIAASLLILVSASVWLLGTKSEVTGSKTFAEAENTSGDYTPNDKAILNSAGDANTIDDQSAKDAGFGQVAANELKEESVEKQQPIKSVAKKQKVNIEFEPELANAPPQAEKNESSVDRQQSAPSPSASKAPQIEEEAEVLEEVVEEKIMELQSVIEEADLIAYESTKTTKKEKRTETAAGMAEDAMVIDGVMASNSSQENFDSYFSYALEEEFSAREIKALKKNVVVEFDVVDSAVANFKTTPNQSSEINVRLLELVKKYLSFLSEDVKGYRLDLGEM